MRPAKYLENLQPLLGTCNSIELLGPVEVKQALLSPQKNPLILASFCFILMNKNPWQGADAVRTVFKNAIYTSFTVLHSIYCKVFFMNLAPGANLDSLTINSLSKHLPHNHHLTTDYRLQLP